MLYHRSFGFLLPACDNRGLFSCQRIGETNLCLGRNNLSGEGDVFVFSADHPNNFLIFCEFQSSDPLKTFLQVRLHPQGIFGLRQDLQQLIIGQEEKPGEDGQVQYSVAEYCPGCEL